MIFFNIVGIVVVILFLLWIYYVGFHCNPYRIFTYYWFRWGFYYYIYYAELTHCYQRLRYGISHDDVWDLDNHLLKILPWALKDLRKSELRPDLSVADWNLLIYGIENYQHLRNCYDYGYHKTQHHIYRHDFEEAMKILVREFDGLWI